jgi:hypothetical protein
MANPSPSKLIAKAGKCDGTEDVFPVTQFEKILGDMSVLPGISCNYLVVPRLRGQQLKDPAQLDGWLRDGSAAHIDGMFEW